VCLAQHLAVRNVRATVQLVRLKQWAQEQGRWFDDRTQFGDFFDRGSENEVYLSHDGAEIIKLNDFRYSDDNLTPFFERIKAHNIYFPDCSYCLVGFAENRDRRRGSLKLANRMKVHAGQNPGDAAKHLFPFETRVPVCFFRPYTCIEER